MIPPENAPGQDLSQRRGPAGWSGPLAVIFIALGALFTALIAYMGRSGSLILLTGGALVCWAVAAVLITWRRRR